MRRLVVCFFAFASLASMLASAATPLSQCSSLSSGDYVLVQDVYAAPPGTDCFVASSAGVSLDCAGFRVVGSQGGVGFKNPGFANVALRGCTIQNFSVGVSFEGSTAFSGGSIASNAVSGTSTSLKIINARSLSVSQNSFSGVVQASSSSELVFSSNTLNAVEPGALKLEGVTSSIFSSNAVSSGGEYALWATASSSNSFQGGSFAGATTDALLDSSPPNSFTETNFFHGSVAFAGSSDGAVFKDCALDAARLRWLSGAARVTVKNSARVRTLDANGVAVEGASVNATAADGASLFFGWTNAAGLTDWFEVIVFQGSESDGSTQSSYLVRASKNGFSSSATEHSSPKKETTLYLGASPSPIPSASASPAASPSASIAASLSPTSRASPFAYPWLSGASVSPAVVDASAAASPVVSEALLSVRGVGVGEAAAELGAEIPDYARTSPSPALSCVWCGVASAAPWWAWVGGAFAVIALFLLARRRRQSLT
ncbi:MAG: NosD domain-containing protein [Candidatus Norongarragalinales archaeon]